jgi:twitching motility protein PilT
MEIDFSEVLREVTELHASDLHLTVGTAPMVRVRGELRGLDNYPPLNSKDTRDIIYSILSNDQRKRLEEE